MERVLQRINGTRKMIVSKMKTAASRNSHQLAFVTDLFG
jgi:hypothetical protein